MNRRLACIQALALLAILCFASCKDREEKAFKREEKKTAKSISKDKSFLIGTWIKESSSGDSMPDVMIINNNGRMAAYEDNDGGELGLDPEKEKHYSWKTDGDFFIINYGWETVKYYYRQEGKTITFSDEITRNTTAIYTRK